MVMHCGCDMYRGLYRHRVECHSERLLSDQVALVILSNKVRCFEHTKPGRFVAPRLLIR